MKKKFLKPLIIFFSVIVFFRIFLLILPFKELEEFRNRQYSTRIFDRNDELIQILPLENGLRREFMPISKISIQIQKEFLKAEDKRFYFHFGVDLISICRAFFQNVSTGRKISGASTITMQLSRMIFPPKNRNLFSKLQDSINAIRIEGKLSKKQILELYLNNIPFGKNTEGITSATRTFFSKNIENLTEEEIQKLAQIPRNPNLYNNLEKKFIYPFLMPHYIRFLQNSGKLKDYEVKLSCDLRLQKFIEEKIKEAMFYSKNSRIDNASVLVINSKTGEILSWIGNENWNSDSSGQIDGVLNKMQPGSSMKPFLYALALDSGFEPNCVLADVPSEFGDKNVYIPQNFNNRFNGAVRFRVALASSLNIPAVFLLDSISEEKYLKTLEQLGFESLRENGKKFGLGLALGAGEVSLKELVQAFSVFVNDGNLKINGENRQIFSKDASRIICSILSDKNARSMGFGYSQTFQTNYPAIFKTGTSNQYQNIVALGSTKNFTVGVWMGNLNGNTVIGKTGSSLPAATSKAILDYLESNSKLDDLEFLQPENYEMQKICALSGKNPCKYCNSIVFEYVKKNEKLEFCDWHKKEGTFYPIKYQKWLSTGNAQINYEEKKLQIIAPNPNSIYYFDESKKNLNQIVHFEAIGGNSEFAEIFIDDVFYKKINRPFVLNIPAKKGKHTILIECDNELSKTEFTVK